MWCSALLSDTNANNNATNSSISSPDVTYNLVYDVILSFIIVSVFISNSIVIIMYSCSKFIRKKTSNLLLCDQAFVDIFNGAVAGGVTLLRSHSPILLTAGVYQFSIALSFHTVILISVERYVFILKPLFHRRSVTKGRISIILIASWFFSVLWIPVRLIHYDGQNRLRPSFCWFVVISNGVKLLLMILVACLHALTYAEVKRHIVKRNKTLLLAAKLRESYSDKLKMKEQIKEMRVSKIFIAMFLAFVVTYSPMIATGIVHIVGGFKENDYKYTALDILFYFANSLFNPTLTLAYKEDYKKIAGKLKRRMIKVVYPLFFGVRERASVSSASENDIKLTQSSLDG